jgi:hypothetical protein
MLNKTAALELPLVSPPAVTGNFLTKSRLSLEARIAVTLRLLCGDLPITESAVTRAARLCRARRGRINQHLERHRNVGEAMAKAFWRASIKERVAFVRSVGCEEVWNALTQAVN